MPKAERKRFRIPGIILVVAGITLPVIYFLFNFRFEVPVFAVFSSYMKTSFLTTFKTNFADETIMLLLLVGFFYGHFRKRSMKPKDYGSFVPRH